MTLKVFLLLSYENVDSSSSSRNFSQKYLHMAQEIVNLLTMNSWFLKQMEVHTSILGVM